MSNLEIHEFKSAIKLIFRKIRLIKMYSFHSFTQNNIQAFALFLNICLKKINVPNLPKEKKFTKVNWSSWQL